ncbi:MAG TPA: hypothetical protein P5531_13080 [Bacteroidales bacterium]|nr:hypothetical protein [Bacteroidales bacterium]HSA44468.1 hypothetical protein [Bacteroidales bacterium]
MKKTAILNFALFFCFGSGCYASAGSAGDAQVFVLVMLCAMTGLVLLLYTGDYLRKNGKRLMLAATAWLKKKTALLLSWIHGPDHDDLLYGKV